MFKWSDLKEAVSGFLSGIQQGALHTPFARLPFNQPLPVEDKSTLIIDRKTWVRGRPSNLLGRDGRCCLGFYCAWKGIPDQQTQGIGNPVGLLYLSPGWKQIEGSWLTSPDVEGPQLFPSRDNLQLVRYNDTPVGLKAYASDEEAITEELREKKLSEIFSRNGVPVRFEN